MMTQRFFQFKMSFLVPLFRWWHKGFFQFKMSFLLSFPIPRRSQQPRGASAAFSPHLKDPNRQQDHWPLFYPTQKTRAAHWPSMTTSVTCSTLVDWWELQQPLPPDREPWRANNSVDLVTRQTFTTQWTQGQLRLPGLKRPKY